jgi:glutamyl-tRNA reductase
MLSQSLGEYHVTAQVKEALEEAVSAGWAGAMMREWVSAALHVSKHMKQAVNGELRHEEIEDMALTYLGARLADAGLAKPHVLVVGTGVVGRDVTHACTSRGWDVTWCYHRHRPELPKEDEGDATGTVSVVSLNALKDHLGGVDAVVSAADAPGCLLHAGHAPFFDQERAVTVIDLAVPRNVEPELDRLLAQADIVDLDGLKKASRQQAGYQEHLLNVCYGFIEEHMNLYDNVIASFQGRNAPQ